MTMATIRTIYNGEFNSSINADIIIEFSRDIQITTTKWLDTIKKIKYIENIAQTSIIIRIDELRDIATFVQDCLEKTYDSEEEVRSIKNDLINSFNRLIGNFSQLANDLHFLGEIIKNAESIDILFSKIE